MAWLADEDGGGLLATGNTSSAVSVAIVNEGAHKHSSNNSYKVCVLKPVLSSISRPMRPQLKDVTHVSWSKKFQFLASCHGYNHVLIWDRHGNRVTNKPVVIIRDDSRHDRDVVPACIVTWAHSQPVLLITYEDGVMKLVRVTSEENSSSISVDNISFSDAYSNGEHGLTSACWSYDDTHIFSSSSLNVDIHVTNVERRTVVKKLTVGVGYIKNMKSWYSPEGTQVILVHHVNGCISLVTVTKEFEMLSHKVINSPFTTGTAVLSWRDTDGMLAVGGKVEYIEENAWEYMVYIYHSSGKIMKKISTPCFEPIAAVCWVGANSLSVAAKNHVHVINVSKEVPTLQYLAAQKVPKLQKQEVFMELPVDIRVNLIQHKRTLPKNTPRVFTDTESASQCTLKVIHGRHALQEAQFMVAEVGGEAVALRAIRQTALMSLGNHYEILLRNDCLQTDEPHLSLLHRVRGSDDNQLHCTYSDNFSLALRMQHKPLSRGTSTVCSLGSKGSLFFNILYSEKRSVLSVKLYSHYFGMEEYKEASGLVHKPCNYSSGDARSIVLMYDQEEVFQLVRWQEGNFSVRYKTPFSMCAAFCTAVSCISRKLI